MPALTEEAVLSDLQPIFEEAMDSPGLVVTPESSALTIPSWDSLAHIEMIELVERHFGVKFTLGELQDLKTVGNLINLILKKKGAP